MAAVCAFLNIYLLVVFARVLFSWFPIAPGGAAEQVYGVLHAVTEPVLGPLRRAIPPVRMGMSALDLSPIILLVGIRLLTVSVC